MVCLPVGRCQTSPSVPQYIKLKGGLLFSKSTHPRCALFQQYITSWHRCFPRGYGSSGAASTGVPFPWRCFSWGLIFVCRFDFLWVNLQL